MDRYQLAVHATDLREGDYIDVEGWGWFSYCETAIAEDLARGLNLSL